MNVVFDTNVLLAAFLTEGVCAKLLVRARRRQFDLITCPFILQEFERILTKKFSATKSEKDSALAILTEAVQNTVLPSETVFGICRDKDDDNVLACALEATADYLVTGDKDLLTLYRFKGTQIVTPREFELLFDR